MAESHETHADDSDTPALTVTTSTATLGPDWETEDAYWQSAYPERPYARADRGYEYYRAAYRYGTERATQWRERDWASAERALRDGWSSASDGDSASWMDMRDAVRDAWDRVRGRSDDDRTHIR
jgi:hypothetical protein